MERFTKYFYIGPSNKDKLHPIHDQLNQFLLLQTTTTRYKYHLGLTISGQKRSILQTHPLLTKLQVLLRHNNFWLRYKYYLDMIPKLHNAFRVSGMVTSLPFPSLPLEVSKINCSKLCLSSRMQKRTLFFYLDFSHWFPLYQYI